MATTLFELDFVSPLTGEHIEELKSVTGMIIGDVRNPRKDTPGKGWFARNAYLTLERERQEGEWFITAYTHDLAQTDLQTVMTMRRRLHDLLDRIATRWEERVTAPELSLRDTEVPSAPL